MSAMFSAAMEARLFVHVSVSKQWHLKSLTLVSSPHLSLSPTLPFGSQALLPQQPERHIHFSQRKLGAGLSLVHVIEQKCTEGGKKSSYPQMPVSCGAFSYLVTNHIFHHLPSPTPVYLLLDVHCPWERLSLWGVASSSSHLVLGKLGYTNNISAQNISATSGPGWREIVA